ncbi:hypothetical protein WMF38_29550 [Sorangium sp. So ce118]
MLAQIVSWRPEAPQGIARNGKYYLDVPLNNATGAKIGVGVSNDVAGPFMDPLGRELAQNGSGSTAWRARAAEAPGKGLVVVHARPRREGELIP